MKFIFSVLFFSLVLPLFAQTPTHSGLITIPVVVHIVWKEDEENISDEQVHSQIDALNRDFQLKNDISKIGNDFKPLAAAVGIHFCLAKIDPKGKATTGITRTRTSYSDVWRTMGTSQNNPTPRRRIYHTILEGKDAWDTQKYLNIWVGKLGNGKVGYSTFPDAVKPEDVDGIVVDPYYFGTLGTAAANVNFNQGRTAVHEIGHFLNLLHPWGKGANNPNCTDDDGINDTPRQEEAVVGCPTTFIFNCDNKKVMSQNFMNFVHDDCMAFFTLGQKQRMIETLTTTRVSLTSSSVCTSIATIDNALINSILVYPNPAEQWLVLQLPSAEQGCTYVINDSTGKQIGKGKCTEKKNNIDLSQFSNGFYQIGINIENRYVYKSFIVYK